MLTFISIGNVGFSVKHLMYWQEDDTGGVLLVFDESHAEIPNRLYIERDRASHLVRWLHENSDITVLGAPSEILKSVANQTSIDSRKALEELDAVLKNPNGTSNQPR